MISNRKTINYIGFYVPCSLAAENRVHSLAAVNKMDYICSALVKAGYRVNIVSPSWSQNTSGFYCGKTLKIDENCSVTLCPTFGTNNKVLRVTRVFFSLFWLLVWILIHIKHDEKVVVYHALWIAAPLSLAKVLKQFHLILEVEELYCKVTYYHSYWNKLEGSIIHKANMYIFPNDIMPVNLNVGAKPYVIVYGVYRNQKRISSACTDGKIHVVYAGVIDKFKAGAFNAVESAAYLSNDYAMHILGFGDTGLLQQSIDRSNLENECKIAFHGQKSGDEYISFMQKCHIGLSTQTTTGAYLDCSFPSKILSYLSLGLRVVSGNIECVAKSQIGDIVTYYSEDTPEAIADAIKNVDIQSYYEPEVRLNQLDAIFVDDMKSLLEQPITRVARNRL